MKLFISDLHLSVQRRDTLDIFLRFLQERAAKADELYILGDLFDAWIGDGDDRAPIPALRDSLRTTVGAGCRIFIQHGNRDFLLGKHFARQTGTVLIGEEHCIDIGGRKALLMHGDLLCTDDHEYQRMRRLMRSPITLGLLLLFPLALRVRIAARLRKGSANAVARKPREIMDVNRTTVDHYQRKHGARLLIHGHTHQPALHDSLLDGLPAQRFVLGDWQTNPTIFVQADADGLRLEAFS
ncbi:MAG: UDP-2,3-diacylglucosamine diphosphatase [Gammaproteobacteria bacterium]|nr:UDP-2,3-diacylglucosamine diphosphatase [Gammaproteobacteria bacterium]MBU1656415.1 UDP-2,3-diacylglucosamine diphosphatase [Gammaproteobacteria bacterium]MBU1960963.1 UDP-2,3-diacylglucosamine diphosphatase [Gammaproteobacteria bacterium]